MEKPDVFQPVEAYDPPSLPTVDWLQATLTRLRTLVQRSDAQPFIADDRLQRSTLDMLDQVVAPPACGPLVDELQATLGTWVDADQPTFCQQLVVMPPCDEKGVMESWAERYGHQLLDAPARDTLFTADASSLPRLEGASLLVIPRLEEWFVRHRNGLALVRALLSRLNSLGRRCVIGCNSWAWAFLSKAVGAQLMLPNGLTFKPFDATRLSVWFAELAQAESLDNIRFRLSTSGRDVLARDDDGDLVSDHFTTLAARSRGIPWVAWHMWRRSLRSTADQTTDTQAKPAPEHVDGVPTQRALGTPDDEQTLWVVALEQFALPGGDAGPDALIVLQALLIHGALSLEQLARTTPIVGQSNVLAALIRSGVVQRDGALFRCCPAAYPAIRSGLHTAGFSMDRL